jgi:hemolysin III
MPLRRKESDYQSPAEEFANTISHAFGLTGAIIAAPYLIYYAAVNGDPFMVAGVSIFISTAILLYLSSTVYHAVKEKKAKEIFQIVDHAAIFLLIAGTYTPFTLGVLKGIWGWTLFGLVWSIAIGGIILKVVAGVRWPRLSTALYLIMGWLIIIAIRPLFENVPVESLIWIALGGFAYTAGVIFYAMPKLHYSHFIWHLFVLTGTACHVVAVALVI